MNTDKLIKQLRQYAPLGPLTEEIHKAAAAKLEELQRLNDSMQVDRELWIKVGREKLERQESISRQMMEERGQAIKERDEARAEAERLKQALHDARIENSGQAAQLERTRPEPSRLEIAARAMQGLLSHSAYVNNKVALEYADALIAAAKEAK